MVQAFSSKASIMSLFRSCTELRQICYLLDGEAKAIQEIALNASIAAGQTGNLIRIYSEIAHQIDVTSQRMQTELLQISEAINRLSNLMLKTLILERRIELFEKARSRIKLKENIQLFLASLHSLHDSLLNVLEQAPEVIFHAKSRVRNLSQVHYRLFGLLNILHIHSTNLPEVEQLVIKNLGDNLSQHLDRILEMLMNLNKALIKNGVAMQNTQNQVSKEYFRAKIHAA